jgi:transglutaminase-like putative cysteine protease
MNTPRRIAVCLALLAFASVARAQFTAPTEEELKMTAQPEVPGAPAVYLFREEITDDKLHSWIKYARIKILTERGKEYANQELSQYSNSEGGGYTVGDIQGRTIHADGTIIPFTGKPFEKLIEKGQGYKAMAKVFTLPDVQVGSIIEFRYVLRYDDWYYAPSWYVQSDLYTRKAHYLWRPTDKQLISKGERGEELTSAVAWTPILPKGFEVKQSRLPGTSMEDGQALIELNIHDVEPFPDEEYMPPIGSLSYRVLFYYTPYKTVDEFWKNQGKQWSKNIDRFANPGPKVKDAVNTLAADSDTPEQKLRKFYAAIMALDNTSYNRDRSKAEDKAQGLGAAKSSDDILERKRGSDDQLAELFVAMARAAGMKAYIMAVTNRDRSVFIPGYLNFSQLDDLVAIVQVNGKDQYFDPGQRYCPYGHLAWKHSMAAGLRQAESGTALLQTPGELYNSSRIQRVADLTLDEHGEATGTAKLTWIGAPALRWRQAYLRGDETSLKRDLRVAMEHLMPNGMEVTVGDIQSLDDYEQPLIVNYTLKGQLASTTGKRLLVPGDVFEMNTKPAFPHEKRETPVYFEYPHMVQDAVRVKFPEGFTLESAPAPDVIPFNKSAAYSIKSEISSTSVTVRREFDLGNILYPLTDFPGLRDFYTKLETKDQQTTVLKLAATSASGE